MVISAIVDILRIHGLIVITSEQSGREHRKIYRRKTSGKCRRIWSLSQTMLSSSGPQSVYVPDL